MSVIVAIHKRGSSKDVTLSKVELMLAHRLLSQPSAGQTGRRIASSINQGFLLLLIPHDQVT